MDSIKHKSYFYSSIWMAAIFTGLLAVLYTKIITYTQNYYLTFFQSHPYMIAIAMPFIFVIATFFVRQFAPDAKGSGVFQVLQAIDTAKDPSSPKKIWQTP